jgi:PadR family transcriptional regulator, regulatory protein PadR
LLFHIVEDIQMAAPRLGDFEYLVLLALLRIGPDAYGAVVRREIETQGGRRLGISAVYTTLERLEQKGLVRSRVGEPTAVRGGRRRKYFELEPLGARALKEAHRTYAAMTAGLDRRLKTL